MSGVLSLLSFQQLTNRDTLYKKDPTRDEASHFLQQRIHRCLDPLVLVGSSYLPYF
jgi:hypothetical protein